MKIKKSREFGMTLIEVIIVVAIVALLSMIAFPNYSEYKQRARRMDAKLALQRIATGEERFYVSNMTYTDDLPQLGISGNESESGYYVISVPSADGTGFQAIAVPAPGSPQIDDSDCQQFSIDDQNVRGSAPDPDNKCW